MSEPLTPGDIAWYENIPLERRAWRIEHVAHGQAFVTECGDGYATAIPVAKLRRIGRLPASVDTRWADANPIEDRVAELEDWILAADHHPGCPAGDGGDLCSCGRDDLVGAPTP